MMVSHRVMQKVRKMEAEAAAKQLEEADTPIELPVTPLGKVAELLLSAQRENMLLSPNSAGEYEITQRQLSINDKLSQARILVDVERGDGQ